MRPDLVPGQRTMWIWTHVAALVLLSGVGGYVWGAEPLDNLAFLVVLWTGNMVALGLWLHRGR